MADTNEPTGAAMNTDDPHQLDVWDVDEHDPDRIHDSLDTTAARIEHQILREAATWENQFDAGPGQVVSVKDAARVIARECIRDVRFKHKQAGWQVDAYQKMVDDVVETVTALRATCEQLAFPMRVLGGEPGTNMPYAYVDTVGGLTIRWNGEQWQVMDGATRIAQERLRHLTEEGYDPTHDDRMVRGELAQAAMFYLDEEASVTEWPWDDLPKRTGDRVRDLEKAGALLAAEIDRLKRREAKDRTREASRA